MSQSGILDGAVFPPPGGGGILTITGDDAVAVGPDFGGNVDLVGAGGISVTGNAGTNTLTITATADVVDTVQTLDATPTPISSVALGVNNAVVVKATVVGAKDDFSESLWGEVLFGARRVAGGAIAVEFPLPTFGTNSLNGVYIDADVNGNFVRIIVRGAAGETWNWSATTKVIVQA